MLRIYARSDYLSNQGSFHPGAYKKRSNDAGHASGSSQSQCALKNCTRTCGYCLGKHIRSWKLVWDFLSATSRFYYIPQHPIVANLLSKKRFLQILTGVFHESLATTVRTFAVLRSLT